MSEPVTRKMLERAREWTIHKDVIPALVALCSACLDGREALGIAADLWDASVTPEDYAKNRALSSRELTTALRSILSHMEGA